MKGSAIRRPPRCRIHRAANAAIEAALAAALGDERKLIIVDHLLDSPCCFATIREFFPRISQQALAAQLEQLMEDGLMQCHPRDGTAFAIYSLTEYGRTLAPLLEGICLWGRAHIERFD